MPLTVPKKHITLFDWQISLGKEHENVEVRIFLMADAANCAIAGQTTPNGYYNIERMLKLALTKGAKVKICGSCADARV